MTEPMFKTAIHGKWILTGEHAVLRGQPAIIFPVRSKNLTLSYWHHQQELQTEFTGTDQELLAPLFWQAFTKAAEILAFDQQSLTGNFILQNEIPIGCGMGGSAALCVAIGRFFVFLHQLKELDLFEFARQLENLFHFESSGADIAVAIADQSIQYSRLTGFKAIKINWQPIWFLSFSGKASKTSTCVEKVKGLWQTNPILAKNIDDLMLASVQLAEKALQLSEKEGLPLLQQALMKGYACYQAWQLDDPILVQHCQSLTEAGAIAVKPTGSGDGGFVISLWREPPKHVVNQFNLIAL